MDQDLQILQEVQEWDKEIYLLKEILEAIPDELAEIEKHVGNEKAELSKYQDELRNLQLKQKEKEIELSTKEENIKKHEAQLSQVKTNKEYASLRGEITSLKADNSLLEETIINLIDDVEASQRKVETQKERLADAEAELKKKRDELAEKASTAREKIDTLLEQKKEKIKEVNQEVASLYEQIVAKKRGLALVRIEGDVCPACQIQLRPQVVNEAKLKEKITLCDNCSRILYTD